MMRDRQDRDHEWDGEGRSIIVASEEMPLEARRALDIDVDRAGGTMRIEWQDGHISTYRLAALRPQCPCAFCSGEMGRPGAVNEHTVFSAEQTTLVDMLPVGHYALQPIWGDGHDTGLYTLDRLRRLCPCAECAMRWRS
jgi:DUF971 family protein